MNICHRISIYWSYTPTKKKLFLNSSTKIFYLDTVADIYSTLLRDLSTVERTEYLLTTLSAPATFLIVGTGCFSPLSLFFCFYFEYLSRILLHTSGDGTIMTLYKCFKVQIINKPLTSSLHLLFNICCHFVTVIAVNPGFLDTVCCCFRCNCIASS